MSAPGATGADVGAARLRAEVARRLGSDMEARWVLEEVLGRGRADGRHAVTDDARARIDRMVDRRLAGEPLQYVLGTWGFRTLDLAVDRRALIPRPETEQVVEVALAELAELAELATQAVPTTQAAPAAPAEPARPREAAGPLVVDLGTGSGAIALSLAAELAPRRPGLRVWATDADQAALALAGENLARVAAANPGVASAVRLAAGRWFDALPATVEGAVDLVVSNPPYVSAGEWVSLEPEVRREPRSALVAGPGRAGTPGLADVEAVLEGARQWLVRPGAVVVELAPHQAEPALAVARRLGFSAARVAPDLAGRPRALVGRLR